MSSTSESSPDESPLPREDENFDTDQSMIKLVSQPISSSSQASSKSKVFFKNARIRSNRKANQEIKKLFDDNNISLWFKLGEGQTYFRIILELKVAYRRSLEFEYLLHYLGDYLDYLQTEENILGEKAGKIQAELKTWEIIKPWKNFNGSNINHYVSNYYANESDSLPARLKFLFFGSKIRKNKNLEKDDNELGNTDDALNESLEINISYQRIDIDWLVRLVKIFKIFSHYVFELIMKSGLAIIIFVGLVQMLSSMDIPDKNLIALLSSIALVQAISISIYYWQISVDNKINDDKFKLDRRLFYVYISIICLAEASLGHSLLYNKIHPTSSVGDNNLWTFIRVDVGLFLTSLIFALTNIAYSISKAKRYKDSMKKRKKFLSIVEKKYDLIQSIHYISGEIVQSKFMFEKYKNEVVKLLEKDSIISSKLILLSNMTYEDPGYPIPLSEQEIRTRDNQDDSLIDEINHEKQ
jgi:hypothetical protein